MFAKLLTSFRKSPVIYRSFIMGTGTVVNSLLGLVFYASVARLLSVPDFGSFSYLLAIGALGADLGSFGLGASIVKFGHKNLPSILTLAVIFGLGVTTVYLLLGLGLSFITPLPYYLSALAAGSVILLYFGTQTFLSLERFGLYVAANISGNLFRLLVLFVLVSTNGLAPTTAVVAFSLGNLFSILFVLLSLSVIMGKLPFTLKNLKDSFLEVLPFSRWLGSSFALAALASRLDIPLLFFLSGSHAVGIYSTAQKLTTTIPQITAAIEGVFSSKLSKRESLNGTFRDYVLISTIMASGLVILLAVSRILIPFVFGEKYIEAIPVFNILIIGLVFFVVGAPFAARVIYSFGKSKIHFVSSVVQLGVSILAYIVFVPRFGEIGAAISFVIVNIVIAGFFILSSARLKTP